MNASSPCKGCQKRSERCHGECKEYLVWTSEQHQAKRKEIDAYYATRYCPDDLRRLSWNRWKHDMRRGRGRIN